MEAGDRCSQVLLSAARCLHEASDRILILCRMSCKQICGSKGCRYTNARPANRTTTGSNLLDPVASLLPRHPQKDVSHPRQASTCNAKWLWASQLSKPQLRLVAPKHVNSSLSPANIGGGVRKARKPATRYGCGSKPMVPFWGKCTTNFRTYFIGWIGMFTENTM